VRITDAYYDRQLCRGRKGNHKKVACVANNFLRFLLQTAFSFSTKYVYVYYLVSYIVLIKKERSPTYTVVCIFNLN